MWERWNVSVASADGGRRQVEWGRGGATKSVEGGQAGAAGESVSEGSSTPPLTHLSCWLIYLLVSSTDCRGECRRQKLHLGSRSFKDFACSLLVIRSWPCWLWTLWTRCSVIRGKRTVFFLLVMAVCFLLFFFQLLFDWAFHLDSLQPDYTDFYWSLQIQSFFCCVFCSSVARIWNTADAAFGFDWLAHVEMSFINATLMGTWPRP